MEFLTIRTGAGPSSRVLQFSSLSFDASTFEIVLALAAGGTLHLATRDALLPGPRLAQLLRDERITNIVFPPSALAALPEGDFPDLRTITVAGEACPGELVDRWAPGRAFSVHSRHGPVSAPVSQGLCLCPPLPG